MNANESSREVLKKLYFNTIVELQPGPAVARALDRILVPDAIPARLHVLAIGKAAQPMARAASAWCDTHGAVIVGGVSVSHDATGASIGKLSAYIGDHPVPGARSRSAAAAIAAYIATEVSAGDHVIVLLSGGASALIGAPRPGIDADAYSACAAALLGAGLSINQMNTLRRTLSRWSGGRLGEALLARGARVNVLVISDVLGDTLAAIGSGPCVPDHADRKTLESVLTRAHVSDDIRASLREMFTAAFADDAIHSRRDDTEIPHQIISNNQQARESVLQLARETGATAINEFEPLLDNANTCGSRIVGELIVLRQRFQELREPLIVCWGGEPTVALPTINPPAGGRMQALALSVAQWLHSLGPATDGITILAAGTDGRDGTTDAAGAIVDRGTWNAIAANGRDAGADLNVFRSHDALKAIGALIPSFASGTNVNDIVIALLEPEVR